MTLIVTPGAPDANAYCDEARADELLAGRVGADAWTGATSQDKETAIRNATTNLDYLAWLGVKTVASGSLRWPRTGVYDQDGLPLPVDEIPVFLESATAEYAFIFVRDGDITQAPGASGLEGLTVGPLEFQFDTGSGSASQEARGLPATVMAIVQYYTQSLYGQPDALRA